MKQRLYNTLIPSPDLFIWSKMRGSCQHRACLPPTSLTASRPAEYDSGSKCGHKEDRRLAYWILTRISHFALNKSGIGISVLCNRCFISITSQFSWAGGGQRYRNDFSENHFVNLWALAYSIDSHVTHRRWNNATSKLLHRAYYLQNGVLYRGLSQLLSLL